MTISRRIRLTLIGLCGLLKCGRVTIFRRIRHEENLGRGVFSSSSAKRAQRTRPPKHVFLEREGVTEISVDRLDHAPPSKAVAIADGNATGRSATFYGWAVVTARKADANGRRVKPSPKLDNLYHADIVLPDLAAEDQDERIRHAQELADNSSWRGRPSPTGRP